MIAQSQSGTGKTAALVLSMLSRVDATQNFTQVRFGMWHIACPLCCSRSNNQCSDTLIVLHELSFMVDFFMTMIKLMLTLIMSDLVWPNYLITVPTYFVFVLYREKCMGGISLTLNLCRSQRWCRWWQLQRPWSFCFNCFGRWALLKWSEFCFTQCAYQIAMPRCILNCFHDSFSWKISDHGAKGKPPKKLCSAW